MRTRVSVSSKIQITSKTAPLRQQLHQGRRFGYLQPCYRAFYLAATVSASSSARVVT